MNTTTWFLNTGLDEKGTKPDLFPGVRLLISLCLLFFLWAAFPLPVEADGGAPNLAYVSGTSAGVSVIDVAARRVSRTLSLAGDPQTILLSFDGSTLYTTQPQRGRVVALDAATGRERCAASIPGEPSLLALSPLGDAIYVAGHHDANVRMLDPSTCVIQHVFPTPGPISGLAVSLLGGAFPAHTGVYQLWVAVSDRLIVLDTDGKPLASFALPAGPQSLCIPPGWVVYISTSQGTVVALDLASSRMTPPLLTDGAFGSMDYDATTGQVYVPDRRHQHIAVLRPVELASSPPPAEPLRTIAVQGVPDAIAITGDGQLGFIALRGGNVAMLDVPVHQIVDTIYVGGTPHFIITGLYPPPPGTTLAQQPTAPPFPFWKTVLLGLLSAIFFLSLAGLFLVLRLFWKQRLR